MKRHNNINPLPILRFLWVLAGCILLAFHPFAQQPPQTKTIAYGAHKRYVDDVLASPPPANLDTTVSRYFLYYDSARKFYSKKAQRGHLHGSDTVAGMMLMHGASLFLEPWSRDTISIQHFAYGVPTGTHYSRFIGKDTITHAVTYKNGQPAQGRFYDYLDQHDHTRRFYYELTFPDCKDCDALDISWERPGTVIKKIDPRTGKVVSTKTVEASVAAESKPITRKILSQRQLIDSVLRLSNRRDINDWELSQLFSSAPTDELVFAGHRAKGYKQYGIYFIKHYVGSYGFMVCGLEMLQKPVAEKRWYAANTTLEEIRKKNSRLKSITLVPKEDTKDKLNRVALAFDNFEILSVPIADSVIEPLMALKAEATNWRFSGREAEAVWKAVRLTKAEFFFTAFRQRREVPPVDEVDNQR